MDLTKKRKITKNVKEKQLHDLLFDNKNTITIREALDKAKKRWIR